MAPRKWRLAAAGSLAFALAGCGGDEVEDEAGDVLDAQVEAVEEVMENPFDTAAIIEEGREVMEEHREAAEVLRDTLRELERDTVAP